jgi:hypothetical protein
VDIKVDAQYTQIAKAIAQAIAATYVKCETTGVKVYGEAQAYARAQSTAEAYAAALGTGWGSIETCYGCKAAADLFVESSKKLFASAMAESRSQVRQPTVCAQGEQTWWATTRFISSRG